VQSFPYGEFLHERFFGVTMQKNFCVGDYLKLKKLHPCGSDVFYVLYAGSDIKIRCLGCNKEMILPRVKLEKNIKSVVSGVDHD